MLLLSNIIKLTLLTVIAVMNERTPIWPIEQFFLVICNRINLSNFTKIICKSSFEAGVSNSNVSEGHIPKKNALQAVVY